MTNAEQQKGQYERLQCFRFLWSGIYSLYNNTCSFKEHIPANLFIIIRIHIRTLWINFSVYYMIKYIWEKEYLVLIFFWLFPFGWWALNRSSRLALPWSQNAEMSWNDLNFRPNVRCDGLLSALLGLKEAHVEKQGSLIAGVSLTRYVWELWIMPRFAHLFIFFGENSWKRENRLKLVISRRHGNIVK